MYKIPTNMIFSGVMFGAALTVAGVYAPSVIIGQMYLENFHMMKVFLTASATSAMAIYLSQRTSLSSCTPRTPSTLNIPIPVHFRRLAPYSGNIVGGLLIGSGMTLTGACPGTVLPQVATGVPTGPPVLFGGLIGGVLFSKFGKKLLENAGRSRTTEDRDREAWTKPTIYHRLGVKKETALVVFLGLCLSVVASAEYFAPGSYKVLTPPAIGGLLIGISQLAHLLLTDNTLGVSMAYEQTGDLFWWLERSVMGGAKVSSPNIEAAAFALGSMLGSWGVTVFVELPKFRAVEIGTVRAILGGVILTFGSRIAGGCTSGHGISGMSQLSVSSIITVAAIFGGGMGLALLGVK